MFSVKWVRKVGAEPKEDKKKEMNFSGPDWLTVMKKIMEDMEKDPLITKEHRQKVMDKAKEIFPESYKAFQSMMKPLSDTLSPPAKKAVPKAASKEKEVTSKAPEPANELDEQATR